MNTWHMTWASLALTTCAVLAGNAHAADKYRITLLPDVPLSGWRLSSGLELNNAGEVLGVAQTSGGTLAYVWSEQAGYRFFDASLTNQPYTYARGLNNKGDVLIMGGGNYPTASTTHIWHADGTVTSLVGTPPGNPSPMDINDQGTVVGTYFVTGGGQYAYAWSEDTGLRQLPGGSNVGVKAVNNAGVAAGTSDRQAALWTASGTLRLLGHLKHEGDYTYLDGLSDAGIGFGGSIYGDRSSTGLIWSEEDGLRELTPLYGLAAGFVAFGEAINEDGVLVGTSIQSWLLSGGRSALPYQAATIWLPGQAPMNINDLIDPGDPLLTDGFYLTGTSGINDKGQILASGYTGNYNGPVLLTPVPEPGALSLLAAGLFVLARRARAGGVGRWPPASAQPPLAALGKSDAPWRAGDPSRASRAARSRPWVLAP